MRSRYSWRYKYPPNVDFDINTSSPQARGLVFWLPLLGPRCGGYLERAKNHILTPNGSPVWSPGGWFGNALLFDDGSSEYLYNLFPPVTEPPFTMACWFNSDDDTYNGTMMAIADASGPTDQYMLEAPGGLGGDPVIAGTQDGPMSYATTTTGFTQDTWHHACGVWAATDDRRAFIDGGSKGTENTNRAPTGIDRLGIGSRVDNSPSQEFSGMIADCRIYDRFFDDQEVLELYRDPWDLYRPRVRMWPVTTLGEARIPRHPAQYNTLAIY